LVRKQSIVPVAFFVGASGSGKSFLFFNVCVFLDLQVFKQSKELIQTISSVVPNKMLFHFDENKKSPNLMEIIDIPGHPRICRSTISQSLKDMSLTPSSKLQIIFFLIDFSSLSASLKDSIP